MYRCFILNIHWHLAHEYKRNSDPCYLQKNLHVYTIEMKGIDIETSYEIVLVIFSLVERLHEFKRVT